ncbi:MAG: hypothetical protein DI533_21010 [Cereibacter sphaeroides]|uniref:VPLPA-CTERM sorting domain-containing protein n=1 Tax=Cereibacter sphaeroides TaxID=1063 RepID=A0A2W5S469_CERSP|nr:MAG: hypothetical protein DI533_21010 [Cereibacter sphaeroides]
MKISQRLTRLAGRAALGGAFALAAGTAANASLVEFKTYNGNVALSTDGWGGNAASAAITANAPSGSKVIAAYLYTATFSDNSAPTTVTLNGTSVSYSQTTINGSQTYLASHRADVTSIVKPVIDGGAGGAYDFTIAEGGRNSTIDGSALVVVYENAALPDASVGILDGFASVTGDTTSINFSEPLDPTEAGFFAEMRLGIGFSFPPQASTVTVNGTLISQTAGGFDDGAGFNGGLITVGGDDDPFSALLPAYGDDHERYDLKNYIASGSKTIKVDTVNATRDDNVFLAAFYVSGKAGFNEPPPDGGPAPIPLPAAGWLLGGALVGLAGMRRRQRG